MGKGLKVQRDRFTGNMSVLYSNYYFSRCRADSGCYGNSNKMLLT